MSDYVTKTNLLSALGRFKENTDNLYGTKAEASDLKSAIDANSKRITNLEQKAGDEIVVDYPSSTYGMDEVPANVAEYAKVSKLRGVSRVENSAINLQTIKTNGYGTFVRDGYKLTITTLNGTTNNGAWRLQDSMPIILGHKYLIAMSVKTPVATTARVGFNTSLISGSSSGSGFSFVGGIVEAVADDVSSGIYRLYYDSQSSMNGNTTYTVEIKDIVLTDLNIYFGTSDLSFLGATDSAKLATIQSDYPELLIPSDYDAGSIVSTTYSGVESRGKNLFNEPAKFLANGFTFSGGYWSKTALVALFETGISFKPNTQYAFSYKGHCSVSNVNFRFSVDYTDGTSVDTSIITSTTDALYTWVSASGKTISSISTTFGNSGSVYFEYLQIEEGSTVTDYHPYMTATLTLPTPVTLKSAGAVAEELDIETGEHTHPVGELDMGTMTWNYSPTAKRFSAYIQDMSSYAYDVDAICAKYAYSADVYTHDSGTEIVVTKGFCTSNQAIFLRDDSYTDGATLKTALSGVMLYYKLATPDPSTFIAPITDNFIEVEGGGTIRPIQTQTTEIDSAMTAEYLSLGANA